MTYLHDTTPANPAQVTDALAPLDDVHVTEDGWCRWTEVATAISETQRRLTAAIGAGGQAVAVKALEWFETPALNGGRKLIALDCFGREFRRIDLPVDDLEARKAVDQASYEKAILSALAHPVQPGWRDMASAPKRTAVLLDIGETIPDLIDARVGQYVTESQARELGEDISSAGGWIIWNTGSDWFVIPFADAHGWMPLPASPKQETNASKGGQSE